MLRAPHLLQQEGEKEAVGTGEKFKQEGEKEEEKEGKVQAETCEHIEDAIVSSQHDAQLQGEDGEPRYHAPGSRGKEKSGGHYLHQEHGNVQELANEHERAFF